jgi:AcrR family transcriptional regulator
MDKAKQKVQQFRDREQAILDAALQLMLDQGEENVTVEQIAEAVDIGKGTIYKHFSSKSEIYIRLMFDYELQVKDKLTAAIAKAEQGDYAAPARCYFESRISDPVRYRLFMRLEERLVQLGDQKEKLEELDRTRREIMAIFNDVMSKRIAEGVVKDYPPYFYYAAYWALTQGAVDLYTSPIFDGVIDDMEGLMKFIMEMGVHMGQFPPKAP